MFLTINICVNSLKVSVKRQTTDYKLIIYIKINEKGVGCVGRHFLIHKPVVGRLV
jgi:hypothetical protein